MTGLVSADCQIPCVFHPTLFRNPRGFSRDGPNATNAEGRLVDVRKQLKARIGARKKRGLRADVEIISYELKERGKPPKSVIIAIANASVKTGTAWQHQPGE